MQSVKTQTSFQAKISGLELGRFRLKNGVNEADMHTAYELMIASHLSKQNGWCNQHLVKLGDGAFLDIAFALTEDHAKEICASWRNQPVCDAFLALIEPENMEFGTIL